MATIALLLLCLVSLLHQASGSQFNVIQYNIEVFTTSTGRYVTSLTYTDTTTIRITPPVPSSLVPSPTPTSSSVSTDISYDVAYTTYYVPGDNIPKTLLSSYESWYSATNSEYTSFVMDITYTAPSSCPTRYEITTTTNLYIPLGAETNLSPTSTTSTLSGGTTRVTAYLSQGAVTPTSTRDDFVQSYYLNSCSKPPSYLTATRASGGSSPINTGLRAGGGDDDYSYDYYIGDSCIGSLCPFWLIYIVVIIPVLALLFLGGLIESYYWFSRLMKGQFALRGVPLLWVAISLWTLLCLRRHRAATPEKQPQLMKQWREMSTGKLSSTQ